MFLPGDKCLQFRQYFDGFVTFLHLHNLFWLGVGAWTCAVLAQNIVRKKLVQNVRNNCVRIIVGYIVRNFNQQLGKEKIIELERIWGRD